jgi:hypothetical protein
MIALLKESIFPCKVYLFSAAKKIVVHFFCRGKNKRALLKLLKLVSENSNSYLAPFSNFSTVYF